MPDFVSSFEDALKKNGPDGKLGVADVTAKFIQEDMANYMSKHAGATSQEAMLAAEQDLNKLVKDGVLPNVTFDFSSDGKNISIKDSIDNVDVQLNLAKDGSIDSAVDQINGFGEMRNSDGKFVHLQDLRDDVATVVKDMLNSKSTHEKHKEDIDHYLQDWAKYHNFSMPMTATQEADALEYLVKASLPLFKKYGNFLGDGQVLFDPTNPDSSKWIDSLARSYQNSLLQAEIKYVRNQAEEDPLNANKYTNDVIPRLNAFKSYLENSE